MQLETFITKLFIKLLRDTFLFQNKKQSQPSLLNLHLIQEFLHWKATWLLSSIWSQFMKLHHFSTINFSVTFCFKELSLIDQTLNFNWKSWKVIFNFNEDSTSFKFQKHLASYDFIEKQKGFYSSYWDTGLYGNYFHVKPEKVLDVIKLSNEGYARN